MRLGARPSLGSGRAAGGLLLALVLVGTAGGRAFAALTEGSVLTDDWRVPVADLKGATLDLRDEILLPGAPEDGGATLLVFWATWCEPCIHEIPVLNELHKYYAKSGLKLLGVGMSQGGDTLKSISEAASRHGMAYRVLFDGEGKAREAFGVLALPAAALIDRRGVVRWSGPSLPPDINARIKSALAPQKDSGSK